MNDIGYGYDRGQMIAAMKLGWVMNAGPGVPEEWKFEQNVDTFTPKYPKNQRVFKLITDDLNATRKDLKTLLDALDRAGHFNYHPHFETCNICKYGFEIASRRGIQIGKAVR